MSYQSFTILAQNRAQLDAQLISKGIAKWEGTGEDMTLVGVLPGLEIVRVPNGIVTDAGSGTPGEGDYVPPTHHGDECYLVKLAHELLASDDSGDTTDGDDPNPGWTRSNLVKSVEADNRPDTINAVNGNFRTHKFGATLQHVDKRDDAALGTWQ